MSKYESPDYQIILAEGNFEIRNYEAFYMVHTKNLKMLRRINQEEIQLLGRSFVILVMKMAFVVPKEKWDAIPKPLDPSLKITQFDAGKYGVISYRGSWSSGKEQQKAEELRDWLEKKGYSVTSGYKMAVYNGPFVPALFQT